MDAVFIAHPPSSSPENQLFDDAIIRDPISLGRAVVRAIRASGQRRVHFVTIIKDGNTNKHFSIAGGPPIQVPSLQLLRDVKTRWDSVYYMIKRLRLMRPAIDHFLASPVNKDLVSHRLSDVEWGVLQDFEAILAVSPMITFYTRFTNKPFFKIIRFRILSNKQCLQRRCLCLLGVSKPLSFLCPSGRCLEVNTPVSTVSPRLAGYGVL